MALYRTVWRVSPPSSRGYPPPRYASDELRGDRMVVLAAMEQNDDALQSAAAGLQSKILDKREREAHARNCAEIKRLQEKFILTIKISVI